LYRHGFVRVAACTTRTALADPVSNADTMLKMARSCHAQGVALAVFPELGVSGYAISDLLQQAALLDAVETAVDTIVAASATLMPLLLVGAPIRHRGALFNCALAIHRGRLLGVVPKIHLPNYREFYEPRHFVSGDGEVGGAISIGTHTAPFGTDLLFAAEDRRGFVVHAEICEDIWVPNPPSGEAAVAGATILTNLSASNITIGKAETRRLLCQSQSARCIAAYLYAAAGAGESTTDLAWDGQASVFENGAVLTETDRFPTEGQAAIADIDLDLLSQERLRVGSFDTNRRRVVRQWRSISFRIDPPMKDLGLRRRIERFPFVPADVTRLEQDCYEAYNIQVSGLAQRLRATGLKRVVIGVSGGLDSTQALIVCAQAFDLLGLPRSGIHAYTMPGFATSGHTKNNALRLMQSLGSTFSELDIRPAALQMLKDIGHPFSDGRPEYDITFENVQAGLRTDYLFRLANHNHGIVIGTGDLSELALGWCTYGVGDQMAHYNVNAGVPKTLIQHLIRWTIGTKKFPDAVLETLDAILATEISPELIPAGEGELPQSSEATIGPYELQDFTLFYTLRYGFLP
jgi:NAD+ synthase (glutamine-hydrolysing)